MIALGGFKHLNPGVRDLGGLGGAWCAGFPSDSQKPLQNFIHFFPLFRFSIFSSLQKLLWSAPFDPIGKEIKELEITRCQHLVQGENMRARVRKMGMEWLERSHQVSGCERKGWRGVSDWVSG